jgi:hypothetical protein
VPIFQNDSAYRDIEFELTRAVVREIELKTPMKVVGLGQPADTELKGRIVSYGKVILNRNQLNEVREAEMHLTVEIVWTDLRTGDILTKPRPKHGASSLPLPPEGAAPPPIPPVIVTSQASFIPELGESITTATKFATDRLAVQIVSAMETPW